MDDQPELLDINSASLEALTTIPGIGSAMAVRIIAARPFASLDDLRRVGGIGPALVERLRLFASVSSAETGPDLAAPGAANPEVPAAPMETEAHAPVAHEDAQEVGQAVEVIEPLPYLESTAPSMPMFSPSAQPFVTRLQALGLSLVSGAITFLLALAFLMGLLIAVNGGLRYVSPEQLSSLGREVDGVNAGLAALQQDMDAVRTRLTNLEGLSGRLSAVEKSTATLQQEMDTAAQHIEELDQRATELAAQLEEMRARTTRFEGFLNGLRELLNGLFKP